ncbi:MAG TPA: hypothetical protein DCM62_04795 [Bacteroidales bacterium]|nr:hypothetical protein [Bacteroidales bacterium]
MVANASPISSKKRLGLLDTLRGLALFGILVVNIQYMSQPMSSLMLGFQPTGSAMDTISTFLIKLLFEGKFYVLFSALFGYGFAVFLSKPVGDESVILPVFRTRLAVLLLFGIAHVVLLWSGDVLVYYALLGFVMIAFRRVSDRGLFKWAAWLIFIPILLTALLVAFASIALSSPDMEAHFRQIMETSAMDSKAFIANAIDVYTGGSFGEMVAMRLKEYLQLVPGVLLFYPVVLAMFLVGFLIGRKKLLENYKAHIPLFKRTYWWGLAVGLPFSVLYAYTFLHVNPFNMNWLLLLNSAGHIIGGIGMSLFYVSAIVLSKSKLRVFSLSKLMSPVGRTALTNYLIQSIIATFIFYGYGLGKMGQVGTTDAVILAVLIFVLQISMSHIWLAFFHFGPFEWLWRSLTYRKVQPFRKL